MSQRENCEFKLKRRRGHIEEGEPRILEGRRKCCSPATNLQPEKEFGGVRALAYALSRWLVGGKRGG